MHAALFKLIVQVESFIELKFAFDTHALLN